MSSSVLVVDDSRTSRRILKDILDRAGYKVVGEAINGKEGVAYYVKFQPDIVTMDITMPEMDGIEALRQIKRENPEAKVIMITAAGQKDKMMEAVKLGAAEFVSKPFVEETVLEALRHCSQPE
ncbi:MAG: response regulator [Butyrivibrio sp.]|uniref:response regulator n=1 Tax=Butyrivibrio sp. TaxID=28121 RepID=UPI001B4AB655|nr:response regulator [Butyrivibrio sp.]MBP3782853.1 response regulator [Butyrivibrio sp.]